MFLFGNLSHVGLVILFISYAPTTILIFFIDRNKRRFFVKKLMYVYLECFFNIFCSNSLIFHFLACVAISELI